MPESAGGEHVSWDGYIDSIEAALRDVGVAEALKTALDPKYIRVSDGTVDYAMEVAAKKLLSSEDADENAAGLDYFALSAQFSPNGEQAAKLAIYASSYLAQERSPELANTCYGIALNHFRYLAGFEGFMPNELFLDSLGRVLGAMSTTDETELHRESVAEFAPYAIVAAIEDTDRHDDVIPQVPFKQPQAIESILMSAAIELCETEPALSELSLELITDAETREYVVAMQTQRRLVNAVESEDFDTVRAIVGEYRNVNLRLVWQSIFRRFNDEEDNALDHANRFFAVILEVRPGLFKSPQKIDALGGEFFGMTLGVSGRLDIIKDIVNADPFGNTCTNTLIQVSYGFGLSNNVAAYSAMSGYITQLDAERQQKISDAFYSGLDQCLPYRAEQD